MTRRERGVGTLPAPVPPATVVRSDDTYLSTGRAYIRVPPPGSLRACLSVCTIRACRRRPVCAVHDGAQVGARKRNAPGTIHISA